MINIKKASSNSEYKIIEDLGFEILHEVYDTIVPSVHTDYFLQEYLSETAIASQIAFKNFSYYLLNFDSKTVGFLGIQKQNKKLILSKLYVLESFRGNKIGKTALEFTIEYATKNKLTSIELIVNRQNQHSIGIYEKNGFKIIESMVNSFPNGYTVQDYKMERKSHQ